MNRTTRRWRCRICSQDHDGPAAPLRCPLCGAPAGRFEALGEPLLEAVRRSCRETAAEARQVAVRTEGLEAYAQSLPLQALQAPEHDPQRHCLEGDVEQTIAFFLTLDSINFGSGWFPVLTKKPGHSGYFTIAAALTERFRRGGPLAAAELAALSPRACADLFGQDPGNHDVMVLMALFATALNDLGRWLLARFGGRFSAVLPAARRSAEKLAGLLIEMPLFRDAAPYRGRTVCFYKRAQIAAADLALAFGRRPPADFTDLDRLTLFADNLVPHVLRLDGVLSYAPELAGAIDAGRPIPHASEAEVEIRACALTAVERLVALVNRGGRRVSAMELDWLLWNRGQSPFYKQSKPRHRTRCPYY